MDLFESSSSLLSLESEDVSCGFLATGFPLKDEVECCSLLLDFSDRGLVPEAAGVLLAVSVCLSLASSSFLFLFLLFFFFLTFSVTPK